MLTLKVWKEDLTFLSEDFEVFGFVVSNLVSTLYFAVMNGHQILTEIYLLWINKALERIISVDTFDQWVIIFHLSHISI
jgi:hypothetical protein